MRVKNFYLTDRDTTEKLKVEIIRKIDLFNLECKNCKHIFKEINIKNTINSKIYIHCGECGSFFYIDFNYDIRTKGNKEDANAIILNIEPIPVGLIDVSKKEVLEDVMFSDIRYELIEA